MKEYKVIFWDFDGVIKDSVNVKTFAYYSLFEKFGKDIANKVKSHHLNNGGMSRFNKFPIYLNMAGVSASKKNIEQYCNMFSNLVYDEVIRSPWVYGAKEYLLANKYKQVFILVTATPQNEINKILEELKIDMCFSKVFGAPTSKVDAISRTINEYCYDIEDCLMIGDSSADFEAAKINKIEFLLRKHEFNQELLKKFKLNYLENFLYI